MSPAAVQARHGHAYTGGGTRRLAATLPGFTRTQRATALTDGRQREPGRAAQCDQGLGQESSALGQPSPSARAARVSAALPAGIQPDSGRCERERREGTLSRARAAPQANAAAGPQRASTATPMPPAAHRFHASHRPHFASSPANPPPIAPALTAPRFGPHPAATSGPP